MRSRMRIRRSGNQKCRRSKAASATRTHPKKAPVTPATPGATARAAAPTSAHKPSTMGCNGSIRPPQPRQRPRSQSQLATGTSSVTSSRLPQCSQADRPATIVSPLGERKTSVARKLPAINPSMAPIKAQAQRGKSSGIRARARQGPRPRGRTLRDIPIFP